MGNLEIIAPALMLILKKPVLMAAVLFSVIPAFFLSGCASALPWWDFSGGTSPGAPRAPAAASPPSLAPPPALEQSLPRGAETPPVEIANPASEEMTPEELPAEISSVEITSPASEETASMETTNPVPEETASEELTAPVEITSPVVTAPATTAVIVETAAPQGTEETAPSVPLEPVKKLRRQRRAILAFTEGITGSYLTRIIRQENRSNFVFEDYLAGLFFNVKTRPLRPVNIMARLSAYYPLRFYFNDIPQPPATPIHYGADLFLGPVFEPHIKNLIRFNLSPGLHLFFENTDRWNYLHLGAAALAGIELPVTARWTVYLDGLASLDYGNLGNNRTMEPYDIVYQYQLGFGLRYSKRGPNVRPWIRSRRKAKSP